MVLNLTTIRLLEISPVTFPAGPSARVLQAKGYDDLDSLQKCEEALHNMFDLSKSEATAMVSRIKALSVAQGEPGAASRMWDAALAELKSIPRT